MPYPNEHSARLIDPNKFISDSFRRKNITKGVDIIIGKLKSGDGSMVTQAYRFDIEKFSAEEAKKWLKDHNVDYISFEPAKPEKINNETKDENVEQEKNLKEIEYKIYPFEITNTEIEEKDGHQLGVFHGSMATEHRDRSGDIIAPEAFDKTLARYKKDGRNIRLFYQHQHNDLPIGIIPIKSVKKDDKNWDVKGELNLDTQKGREVYSLMKQGALSDLSIGYTPNETDWKGKTRIIKELELWEVSVVSEPANPKAVISEVKKATSFIDLSLAPRETTWDQAKAMLRVRKFTGSVDNPSDSYKKAFMWYDEENEDNFTAYKLPYADVIDGRLKAIPQAIIGIAAVLRGARGGVDIPTSDKTKVAAHVNKYYEKMDMESPLKSKELEQHYEFLINEFVNKKLEIGDVESISTKKEFEEILRESGLFSKQAATYLASFFVPKQSESAAENKETLKDLLIQLKEILNKF